MRAPSYTSLDEALEILAPYGIALSNGNSNHAPMVAEALCAMDRPDAVSAWIARYRERMLPRPEISARIRREDWRGALGDRRRFADWSGFFAEELREASWRHVLDCWLERLAPGFCAAATHGVIRVGHAARSLAEGETPQRMRELADAFGSWAATYQELPIGDHGTNGAMTPRQAITRVPIVPLDRRNYGGNITASLAMLVDFPELAPSIGLLDAEGDLDMLLAELTEVFARVYLTNARDIRTTIALIQGSPALLHSAILRRKSAIELPARRRAMRGSLAAGCTPASGRIPRQPKKSSAARWTTRSWSIAPSHMATNTSSSSPRRVCAGTRSAPHRSTLPLPTTYQG